MENSINFINVGSYAIYFMPLTGSQVRDQKGIKLLISVLKQYIKESCEREVYSEVFIYEVNEIACLVCANAKLTMGEVASLIKKGEDTPFDERMNNESNFANMSDTSNVKKDGPLIVIHSGDIGEIGEMNNESMPFSFNWSMAKIIQSSPMT